MEVKSFKQMIQGGEIKRADAMKIPLDDVHEEPGFNLREEGEDLDASIDALVEAAAWEQFKQKADEVFGFVAGLGGYEDALRELFALHTHPPVTPALVEAAEKAVLALAEINDSHDWLQVTIEAEAELRAAIEAHNRQHQADDHPLMHSRPARPSQPDMEASE